MLGYLGGSLGSPVCRERAREFRHAFFWRRVRFSEGDGLLCLGDLLGASLRSLNRGVRGFARPLFLSYLVGPRACLALPNNYLRVAPGVLCAAYTSRAEAEWLSCGACASFAGKPSLIVKMAKSALARAGRRPQIRLKKPARAHRLDRGGEPSK